MATYLITGTGRGIGHEFVKQLAARGDLVIAGVRRPSGFGLGVREVTLDVSDPASVDALAATVHGEPIDVLINNAGVNSDVKTVDDLTFEELERVFRINSVAPMAVARAVMPSLRAGKQKKIINISSIMGSLSDAASKPDARSYAYRASKSCLNMLTVCLGNELRAEGFTCVAMHPGWVRTDMGGDNAPLSPEDSVQHMLKLIDSLTFTQTGAYLDYAGRALAW